MSRPAEEMANIVILDDAHICQLIMRTIIEDKETIGFDCEGVQLDDGNSPPGRTLTLLQIGKRDGTVYIIDLTGQQRGKTLLYEGKVKDMLESESIVKVMHRCPKDVEAFHRDYCISIRNIFDTLAAHIVWKQDVRHTVFPDKLSLKQMTEIYLVDVTFPELDGICDDIPKFWADRPLTAEKLNYTATKMQILFPALYDKLKGHIESAPKEVSSYFHDAVEELKITRIDPQRSKKLMIVRKDRAVFPLLKSMEERYDWDTPVSEFTEDEIKALRHIRGGGSSWKKCTELVKNWEVKCVLRDLDNNRQRADQSTGVVRLEPWEFNRIKNISWQHPDDTVKGRAKELLEICREVNYY